MNYKNNYNIGQTINMIDDIFSRKKEIENAIKENIKERDILKKDIVEYVKKINPELFLWEEEVSRYLYEKGIGTAKITIDEDQPLLYPTNILDFKKYPPKEFAAIFAKIRIEINIFKKILIEAKVIFERTYGIFVWSERENEREEDYFHSPCHLVEDEKYGKKDFFDIINIFSFGRGFLIINGKNKTTDNVIIILNNRIQKELQASINDLWNNGISKPHDYLE